MKYKTIYADPPWMMKGGANTYNKEGYSGIKGVQDVYPLMSFTDIENFLEDNNIETEEQAHLWLWATNNFLPQALQVMERWGFKYITNACWKKNRIGLGQYLRTQHELLLFGRKGKALPRKDRGVSSVIEAPLNKHSKKPLETYNVIERVSYPPFIELFARNIEEPREDWTYWGNQV